MTTVSRPYGLRRRPTYDELVQYIQRDNGEFPVHAPDRKATMIEMMSPYLSAWKTQQQATIAKKQSELAYWTKAVNGGGEGDAPFLVQQPDHDFQSVLGDVDAMVDGRENDVAQQRLEEFHRTRMELYHAIEHEDQRANAEEHYIGTPLQSDPDVQLAAHEGVPLPAVPSPDHAPSPSTETLREAALRGGRNGALSGATARGVQLLGTVGSVAAGSVARDALAGELALTSASGVLGEGLAAAGLTTLGTGLLPVAAVAGTSLLAAAGIGYATGLGTGAAQHVEQRLMTGVHWLGEEARHIAQNAGVLRAQERGVDARPAAMDLNRRQAVGPAHQVQAPTEVEHSYEQARDAIGRGIMQMNSDEINRLAAAERNDQRRGNNRRPQSGQMPMSAYGGFPGGANGPRPLTAVQSAAIEREYGNGIISRPRPSSAPVHPFGIGRG